LLTTVALTVWEWEWPTWESRRNGNKTNTLEWGWEGMGIE